MIRTNRQASDRDRHAETHRCFIASCGVIVSLGAVTRCPMVPRDSNSREPRSMTKGIAKMSCVLGRAVGSLDNSCMTNARNGLLYTAGSGAGSENPAASMPDSYGRRRGCRVDAGGGPLP